MAAELMGQTAVIQGIVDRHDGPARVTKHLGHTLFLESLYQNCAPFMWKILSFGRKKTPGLKARGRFVSFCPVVGLSLVPCSQTSPER